MIIYDVIGLITFFCFSGDLNAGGQMNHIPIQPMPIPSFQRNWQTLKSSVLGHSLPEKSVKSNCDNNIDKSQHTKEEKVEEEKCPDISYQKQETEIREQVELCDKSKKKDLKGNKISDVSEKNNKKCDVNTKSDSSTPSNPPIKLRICVKSEKSLQTPMKNKCPDLQIPMNSKSPDLQDPSNKIPDLREPSNKIPDPDLDLYEMNLQDPDLDQINVDACDIFKSTQTEK